MNNSAWADHLIDELIQLGVTTFVISPGSRSTPLVCAVAARPEAEKIVHLDERGSGFFAVGYARATQTPAAVICTSGTAVANLLPAVVEASQEQLPMILLTADRPPELIDCGANQAIIQNGIFSHYTRHVTDLPCPHPDLSETWLRTTLDQAVYRSVNGPVQINCQFRKPLEPTPMDARHVAQPQTTYLRQTGCPDVSGLPLRGRGAIIAGRMESVHDQRCALALAAHLQWPILPDITSGLRLGSHGPWVIPFFDRILKDEDGPNPGTLIHLGGRCVSTRLEQWMARAEHVIHVADHPFRIDPAGLVSHRVECGVSAFCDAVCELPPAETPDWVRPWRDLCTHHEEALENELLNTDSEEAVVYRLTRSLAPRDALFTGNSLAIRHLQTVGSSMGAYVPVGANRGASGIDGNIAAAAGFGKGLQRTVTLLIGDLAFQHDLNSLALLRDVPLRIIVLNNGGGGIFRRLPITGRQESFSEYFETPQMFSIEKAAHAFGLPYRKLNDWIDLEGTGIVEAKIRVESVIPACL